MRTLKELNDREDDEKATDAQRAVTELHNAWSLFKALRKKTENEKTGLDAKTVLIHFEFCQNTLKDAQKFLEQVTGFFHSWPAPELEFLLLSMPVLLERRLWEISACSAQQLAVPHCTAQQKGWYVHAVR